MDLGYHYALLAGYVTACLGWLLAARLIPGLWPRREPPTFRHPRWEVGWALLGAIGVLLVGQLYVRHWLVPPPEKQADPAELVNPILTLKSVSVDALNQLLIFSPILIVPLLRRQSLDTVWLPRDRIWARLIVGIVLAALAVLAFTLVLPGSDSWTSVWPRVYQPKNTALAVQVLCEDIAIAILFVRIRAAFGLRATIILVACLFALGHIPAMMERGASFNEFIKLALDASLGIVVLMVAQRSADVSWVWCVHFAMDMMQFYAKVQPLN